MIARNDTFDPNAATDPATVQPNATGCNIFQNAPDVARSPLTDRQRRAAALLALGHPDKRVCADTGVNRSTLWRWRKSHPAFRAELASRRENLWLNSADRLRSLMPRALNVLAEHMRSNYDRTSFRAAVSVLKLAGAQKMVAAPNEPTDPLDVVREDLRRERARRGDPAAAADAPVTHDELLRKFNELLAECAADNPQPEYQI
jgi:hypothetical protein